MKNFVVMTPTQQAYDAVIKWAIANKAGNIYTSFPHTYGTKTGISFKKGSINGYANDDFYRKNADEYGPQLSFEAFAAIQDIELGPENMTIKLTSDYSAVIDYAAKTVTVGFQVIPFTKINEVYACTKKHTSTGEVNYIDDEAEIANIIYAAGGKNTPAAAQGLKKAGYKLVKVK